MFTWRRKTSAETIFTPFLEWCYERVGQVCCRLTESISPRPSQRPKALSVNTSGDLLPDLTPYYDAGLLFRHMERLQIDREESAPNAGRS